MEYSVGMLRYVFLKSEWQDMPLLGKTVAEHMFSGLEIEEEEAVFTREGEQFCADVAILALDMPLIARRDVEKAAERMRAKGIGELRLGGCDSPSRILLSKGSKGYFANDGAFLKIVDAKSRSMVYNQMRSRIVQSHLARGVEIPFSDSVSIDATVKVEAGALILPFSRIEGDSHIFEGARVSSSYVASSEIGRGASVEMSHVDRSVVGAGASVGPFARLRGANIGEGCRIGDFVEVKASALGDGAKAAHLAYVGDADVGARTNIGCGVVFCNFDGEKKSKTSVGEGCFIGANVNLVAPLSVGDGAFVAAGTTVTDDVEKDAFAIGRSRQITKPR